MIACINSLLNGGQSKSSIAVIQSKTTENSVTKGYAIGK
jgi:hypothetical protein